MGAHTKLEVSVFFDDVDVDQALDVASALREVCHAVDACVETQVSVNDEPVDLDARGGRPEADPESIEEIVAALKSERGL